MTYFIYGKRTQEIFVPDSTGRKVHVYPDKQFAPIDAKGVRQKSLQKAIPFVTRKEAQEWLDNKLETQGANIGAVFEIRKKS